VISKSQLVCDLHRVDRVKTDVSLCEFTFGFRRQMSFKGVSAPRAVEQEDSAGLDL
jgi:hypothetical protein